MTSRVISELESLGEKEPEAFAKIWDAFGPVIKEGIWEDFERREKLLALSRFTTTTGEKRSLKQYVEDLKPNQTEIYYLTGDSIERLKSNPKLESATARGIEVLLLTDPVDAFWTSAPLDFGGKPLKSLSQGDIDFDLIPLLDDKAEDKKDEAGADEATTIARDQGCARRARLRRARLAAADVERVMPGRRRRRPRPHARAAAGDAEQGAADQADPRDQHAPSAGRGDRRPTRMRPRICRSCCWSRRKSSTASCRKIRRRSPAGSTSWCCGGIAKGVESFSRAEPDFKIGRIC